MTGRKSEKTNTKPDPVADFLRPRRIDNDVKRSHFNPTPEGSTTGSKIEKTYS